MKQNVSEEMVASTGLISHGMALPLPRHPEAPEGIQEGRQGAASYSLSVPSPPLVSPHLARYAKQNGMCPSVLAGDLG